MRYLCQRSVFGPVLCGVIGVQAVRTYRHGAGCRTSAVKKKIGKTSERESAVSEPEINVVTEFPLIEVHGGAYVHVPCQRSDLFAFTTNFPKLREEPYKWYTEVERMVTILKVLWTDLSTLFESVVPKDLWAECKAN